MDGRAFIKQSVQDLLANETKTFDHFIMNLPATAIEFLGKVLRVFFIIII
jgi:tRNA (guanine37-N1)-methyltransferase